MGVKKGNAALRDEVNGVLSKRRAQIDGILNDYKVPRLPPAKPATRPAAPQGAAKRAEVHDAKQTAAK